MAMILLLIVAIFYLYLENRQIKITADKLAQSYLTDPVKADKKFKAKEIELTGIATAIYTIQDTITVIRLSSQNEINIYCFASKNQINNAGKIQINDKLIIIGECIGIKELFNLAGVFIKINSIKTGTS
jgi:tRNA_anti-like